MRLTTAFTRLALGSAVMLASLGPVQAQEEDAERYTTSGQASRGSGRFDEVQGILSYFPT